MFRCLDCLGTPVLETLGCHRCSALLWFVPIQWQLRISCWSVCAFAGNQTEGACMLYYVFHIHLIHCGCLHMAASRLARNVWEALGSWTLRREPDPKQSSQIRLMPLNLSATSKIVLPCQNCRLGALDETRPSQRHFCCSDEWCSLWFKTLAVHVETIWNYWICWACDWIGNVEGLQLLLFMAWPGPFIFLCEMKWLAKSHVL